MQATVRRRGADSAAAVDRDPVPAGPARRQVRLMGRERENAAAVGGRIKAGELVGDAEAADRRRSVGGSDPDGGAKHYGPAPTQPQQAAGEVDVDRDRATCQPHLPTTNEPV